MKFLVALAFLAVVSALPPRQWFGHRQHEDYQLDGPNSYQNKHHQFNLIKLAYKQLIERLNHPSQDDNEDNEDNDKEDNEEEKRAINDIVDTINIIGKIILDNNDDGDDNNDDNGPPTPQHPEHKSQGGDVLNKSPGPYNEVPTNWQDEEEKVSSVDRSKNEIISIVDEIPAADENEDDDVSLDDSVLENDENEHDVLQLVNQNNDLKNLIIAYNSKSVANEVPAL